MRQLLTLILLLMLIPSLTASARSGCCSHHGGVQGCEQSSGRQVCRDGTYSPSCRCETGQPNATYNNGSSQNNRYQNMQTKIVPNQSQNGRPEQAPNVSCTATSNDQMSCVLLR